MFVADEKRVPSLSAITIIDTEYKESTSYTTIIAMGTWLYWVKNSNSRTC